MLRSLYYFITWILLFNLAINGYGQTCDTIGNSINLGIYGGAAKDLAFALNGCETIKGAAAGSGKDIHNAGAATKEAWHGAFAKGDADGKNRGFVYRTDDWIRNNMW